MKKHTIYKSEQGKVEILKIYDSNLKKWQVGYEEIDVTTSYGTTHIIKSGNPEHPPLLLLHGLGANASFFYPNLSTLSEIYQIFAIDIPGQPGKSVPKKVMKSPDNYVEWLIELMNQLSIESSDFTGISLGSYLTYLLAKSYPEKVNKMMLVSPPFLVKSKVQGMLLLLSHIIKKKNLQELNKFIQKLCAPESKVDSDFVQHMYLSDIYTKQFYILPKIAKDHELELIDHPTLVVYGEHENTLFDMNKAVKRSKKLFKNCESIIIRNAGHLVGLERPAVLNKVFKWYLSPTKNDKE